MTNDIEKLKALYAETSKHSNYQSIPSDLRSILSSNAFETGSRWEMERMEYIRSHLDLKGKNILDIGGNTGFFTLESINDGAQSVDYYEGNKTHAEFVSIASKILKCQEKVHVYPQYYWFDDESKRYDIAFCLNVIHHLGDDFMKG